jgi:hypothetical protein
MENAKKFLRENPTESKAVAARIFNVNVNSLITFIDVAQVRRMRVKIRDVAGRARKEG